MMYKVMIVDDEMLVRIGLKSLIDWEELGFTIVAEAGNGEAAYEKYLAHKPDVIITDIRMPKKDGVWLAEKIRENGGNAEIIFLTCHDEFEYARTAMKLGAAGYILKAEMEEEEITEMMLSLKARLDEKIEQEGAGTEKEVQKTSKEGYILGLLLNVQKPVGELKEAFEGNGLGWNDKKYCFLQLDFNHSLKEGAYPAEQIAKILSACMELVVNKYTEEGTACIAKQFGKSVTCFLAGKALNERKVEKDVANIKAAAMQYFGISFKSASTPIADTVEAVREYSNWLYDAADMLFYAKCGQHMSWEDGLTLKGGKFHFGSRDLKRLCESVSDGDEEAVGKQMDEIKKMMAEAKENSFDIRMETAHIMNAIIKKFENLLEFQADIAGAQKAAMEAADLEELIEVLYGFVRKFMDGLMENRIGNADMLIRKAVDYIDEHYAEKISLDEIAGHVGISKYYFSNLFKKEKNINFTSYLNEVRIEKAKLLLKNPQTTVSQVYCQVGFNDQQYFSRTFKKYVGMTVTEYRNKNA